MLNPLFNTLLPIYIAFHSFLLHSHKSPRAFNFASFHDGFDMAFGVDTCLYEK